MAKALTAVAVKTIRPSDQRQEIRDGACQGLYLCVEKSGVKSWVLRFRSQSGKPVKLSLGRVDFSGQEIAGPLTPGMPLSLSGARQLASQVHRDRLMGIDPIAAKKASKVKSTNTFASVAADFVEQHAKPKTRRWKATAKLLGLAADGTTIRKSLCDVWADKPIGDIKSGDIYGVIESARVRGVPGIPVRNEEPSESRARHFHAALSKMFSWAHKHRRIEVDPTVGVHPPDPAVSRDRVLNEAELQRLWQAADAEPTYGVVLKLLILLGQRLNEVCGMRYSELSSDLSLWTLPAARVKNKRAHSVPLSPIAQALIQSVPNTGDDLIFSTTGSTAISGFSKLKRRLDQAMGDTPPWRLHDIRRSFVTHLAELGVRGEVLERLVNHISGSRGGIAGVYNRSELMNERRAALELWSSHVEQLVSGNGNVVRLRA
jgi:integrase